MTDIDELTKPTLPTKPTLRADAQRNRVRILDAAESVFAEQGASASTEEVASRAGVAIGTVFRHFPTKRDLLSAIMTDLRRRLTAQARSLALESDPATALFEFATSLVGQATTKRTVAEVLTGEVGALGSLQQAVEVLLLRAQRAGAVRPDARIMDVMALLAAASQGALRGGWDRQATDRMLGIIFDGLRAGAVPTDVRVDMR